MTKTAIILGSTGLTGGVLLNKLLENQNYQSILLFSRKSCGITHEKLTEYIIDLFDLESYQNLFKANDVFCCIGTTKSKTPNKDVYRKIDKGIPESAAKLSELNGINTFIVVSALGANPRSRIFYNQIKGEMEEAVLQFNIPHCYILQPSLIIGDRKEVRIMERLGSILLKLLKPLMIGDLAKFRPISADKIADCMIWLSKNGYDRKRIPSDKIIELSKLK